MKTILIDGGDQLGKNSLIEGLCKHFNYENISIRHFGKPPKVIEGESPLQFQSKCFIKEGFILKSLANNELDKYNYFQNITIWNRTHLGEYTYGQMFRNADANDILQFLNDFEEKFLDNETTYLIMLTADPEFFLKQEDGLSFSKNLEQKTKELQLFNEIYGKTLIKNKIKIKVNDGTQFIPKETILNQVINLIK